MIKTLICIVVYATFSFCSHPSDQELEERFRSKHSDFARVEQMLEEDTKLVRLTKNDVFCSGEDPCLFKEGRIAEYRNIMSRLDLSGGIHRDSGTAVRLIVSVKRFPVSSSEKSYLFTSDTSIPTVQSLDQIIRNDRGDTPQKYKSISEKWYLVYESW